MANPEELQVEDSDSVDRPGRMENPDWPYVRESLGHWAIKKGVGDHLRLSTTVEHMCVVRVLKTLV